MPDIQWYLSLQGVFSDMGVDPHETLFTEFQSHLYQGRMSGCAFFLLACIHPVMSCRAGWIFHPSMSLGSFGSSKPAALCMQATITCAHSFYLGIDDFDWIFYVKFTAFSKGHHSAAGSFLFDDDDFHRE